MLIRAYGLFWRADEIEWFPGSGNKETFRLLGRFGKIHPKLEVADFRRQRGLYVLYDDYGPSYVGLAGKQDIGNRLRDHQNDHLADKWDRFSWFGFRGVSSAKNTDGLQKLGKLKINASLPTGDAIADMEALLIWSLGLRANVNWMHFRSADRWEQIDWHERATYLSRIAP